MKELSFDLNIMEMTIAIAHQSMKNGKLTARQLIENYIHRINALDKSGPSLNSIIHINQNALTEADQLDSLFKESGFVGPLHGIPVLIKDNINTQDMITTAGSLSLKDFTPSDDAFIIKKLKEAGAIILAKVNLHEFAIWGETISSILGQTLNPYDLTRTPGGSSGGTGSAVAANLGMVGIGTDTVNSVRSPASACSLVGFRPTVGLVSRSGIVPYSLTQDTAGPITRTVEDSVKLLDVIRGFDPQDEATKGITYKDSYTKFLDSNGLSGKRIGILRSLFGTETVHLEVNEIVNRAILELGNNGANLVEITDKINTDNIVKDISVHLFEFKRDINEYLSKHSTGLTLDSIISSGKFHEGIGENIRYAQSLDTESSEYKNRLMKRELLREKLNKLMDTYNVDALVYPHQKRPVAALGESQLERNGVISSVTGFPACTVPAGFTTPTSSAPLGIPIGIEFMAREWNEGGLIEIAYSFEQSTKHRRPPII